MFHALLCFLLSVRMCGHWFMRGAGSLPGAGHQTCHENPRSLTCLGPIHMPPAPQNFDFAQPVRKPCRSSETAKVRRRPCSGDLKRIDRRLGAKLRKKMVRFLRFSFFAIARFRLLQLGMSLAHLLRRSFPCPPSPLSPSFTPSLPSFPKAGGKRRVAWLQQRISNALSSCRRSSL